MERDALYWKYFYKFQSLLARDVNYLEMIRETEPTEGNGVRKESSLPFGLIEEAHHLAYLSTNKGSYPVDMMSYSSACRWSTLNQHPWIKEVQNEAEKKLIVTPTDKDMYHVVLDRLKPDKRVYLDNVVEADNYYYIEDRSGKVVGGFATTRRGYLTGVFTLVKGIGKEVFRLRLQQARKDLATGVKQFRIFCTGDFLKEFYEELGFKVTDVVEWDDHFAPDGWNYEEKGRPNLYNMEKSILF